MCGRVLLSLASLIIALLAVFIALPEDQLPVLQDYHELLKDYLSVFSSCPFHSSSKRSAVPVSEDGVYNVVRVDPSDRIFSKDELAQYDGKEGSPGLYLAILGLVYDVSSGRRFYEAGAGYGFFAGRDGTKAFMTGEFTEEGLIDEVTGLTPAQMLELERWIKFYDENYVYIGRVTGNFYDAKGKPTQALYAAVEGIKQGHTEEDDRNTFKKHFPYCNSQWSQDTGGVVWCTDRSGGEKRDWVGVPRKVFQPGSRDPRCACVRTTGPPFDDPESEANVGDLNYPGLQEYEGCPPESVKCHLKS